MTALEKMRKAFEECTVMAGVEPDFECIYITKDAANALFSEAEAENAKLRELVRIAGTYCVNGLCGRDDGCPLYLGRPYCALADRMRELGVEVDAQ